MCTSDHGDTFVKKVWDSVNLENLYIVPTKQLRCFSFFFFWPMDFSCCRHRVTIWVRQPKLVWSKGHQGQEAVKFCKTQRARPFWLSLPEVWRLQRLQSGGRLWSVYELPGQTQVRRTKHQATVLRVSWNVLDTYLFSSAVHFRVLRHFSLLVLISL